MSGGLYGAPYASSSRDSLATVRALAASYAYFRTFHRDVEDTIRNRGTPLAMPALAIGGKGALGQAIPDHAQLYVGDVTAAVHPCRHWVAEESPELLLEQLIRGARRRRVSPARG